MCSAHSILEQHTRECTEHTDKTLHTVDSIPNTTHCLPIWGTLFIEPWTLSFALHIERSSMSKPLPYRLQIERQTLNEVLLKFFVSQAEFVSLSSEHCSLSRLFRRCITPRSDSLRQTMLFHLKPILHEEAFPGHQYVATSPARYLSNIRLLKLSLKLLSLLSLKFSPPPQLDNCATLGCWSWRLWRPWQWLLHTLMHLLHVAYVAHVLHMCSLMY